MVSVETFGEHYEKKMLQERQQILMHHWMLDEAVANEFSNSVGDEGLANLRHILDPINSMPEAVKKRDVSREEVINIFNGESDKQLFIIGPCSLDTETDYTELFDYIEELQDHNPGAVIGLRANGAKPRTGKGNTGLFNNTIEGSRSRQLEIFQNAFRRGIPIFTEITDKDQLGTLAPYLTGAWLGARDMGSTELRKTVSAYQLPVMVKNSKDGRVASLRDALLAVGSNTEQNDGSGVSLGSIASTCSHKEGGPTMFTVGQGNKHVAIIARGYDLTEEVIEDGQVKTKSISELMSPEQAEQLAIDHLSKVCMVAAEVHCAAFLDGSHDVPAMLLMDKRDGNRFLNVLRQFIGYAKEGRIRNVNHLRGFIGEISVSEGKTDVNLTLGTKVKKALQTQINKFKELDAVVWQDQR